MKEPCISMRLHDGSVEISNQFHKEYGRVKLPPGCIGIMFVFESKKAAREFDSTAGLTEIEPTEE